jgi:hypothetical protein
MRRVATIAGLSKAVFGILALGVGGAACSAGAPSGGVGSSLEAVSGSCATPVVVDQSLFVALEDTQGNPNPLGAAALKNFSFETVMNQIMTTGKSKQSALSFYDQLLNTLNDPPCTGTINGFPVECPRPEGILASTNPFTGDGKVKGGVLTPVALVNRFDLAPSNGANCGEYRAVFGMHDLPSGVARFLMIFEATMPNPAFPKQGLTACLPIAQFWDNLSAPGITQETFVSQLQDFYFKGLAGAKGNPDFPPVISAANYGIGFPSNTNTGQIRTNFLDAPAIDWQLRQFEISQVCDESGDCTLTGNNVFVGNNPFGGLFAKGGNATFQSEFISQVKALSVDTIPLISMTTPNVDNAGQSDESDSSNDYACLAGEGKGVGDFFCNSNPSNTSLVKAIQAELTKLGKTKLTPLDILQRATTQSCAGCHQLSPGTALGGGLTWPQSEGFTQINEEGQQSLALTGTFLPFRSTVLTSFIDKHCSGAADDDEADGATTVAGTQVGSSN